MNLYASLASIKSELGISGTNEDAVLIRTIEAVSRQVDTFTSRHFYAETATKYFDGEGTKTLIIPDLLSITSIGEDSDGDEDYTDYAWATTDYYIYPQNKYPKSWLLVNPLNGDYSTWTWGVHNFAIEGLWGYGNGRSATPYSSSGITVTVATADGTTLTLSAEGTIEAGHTILVEDEQMYISAVTSDSSLEATAERGVNGTDGAIHSTKTAYIYEYPFDLIRVCSSLAGMAYETRGKGFKSERLGDYSYTKDGVGIPEPERSMLLQFRRETA